jgi:hypothetical protein
MAIVTNPHMKDPPRSSNGFEDSWRNEMAVFVAGVDMEDGIV